MGTRADCKSARDKLVDDKLVKNRLWAKSYNDVWPRVDCKQNHAMIFDPRWIMSKVLQTYKDKYKSSLRKSRLHKSKYGYNLRNCKERTVKKKSVDNNR